MPRIQAIQQRDAMDCGPTCLAMVCNYYGKRFNVQTLRDKAEIGKEGVNLLGISQAAESIGFRTQGVSLSLKELAKDAPLPCILHWDQNHFVVLHKTSSQVMHIADPALGLLTISKKDFLDHWAGDIDDGERTGITLLLEPTPDFYKQEGEKMGKAGWGLLIGYFLQQKRYIIQLIFGLLLGSLLQLIFPFLTQSIVDTGINTNNLGFIYIVLIAQFMLFFGRTAVEFIRSRILLYISTKINLSILSDFWIKLMKLPLSFFDTKMTGDILQRIGDHRRIENFLTGTALNTFFSLFNLLVFSVVLLQYNTLVFGIFCLGSVLYLLWIRIFLRYRRNLDHKRFSASSKENSATMQLVYGMQDIKLNGAEQYRRWEWEGLQAALFKLSFKSLSLSQYQQAGAFFINEGKNILITFFVAKSVLEGRLTLGEMMAVQYIIGQLNSPVEQLIGFVQQAQDARISLDRLNEIHQLQDEEGGEGGTALQRLPTGKSIRFNNLSFTYAGAGNEPVLKNINLLIPEGKITAIVGMSGSGKTTLLKLLLKFYTNYQGDVTVGETTTAAGENGQQVLNTPGVRLQNISAKFWRSQCGSVMQDGYIYSDTIARNIAVSDEVTNYEKLLHASRVANILSFIEGLPLGFNTKIGSEGSGISAGQKQRILIARSVYKNPEYIFFDEATNSLDANNEKVIMENMQQFFKGKTVVVVAHRLSTVKNADNIVVLHNGDIIENGTHEELAKRRGSYYELVRNQLELGD